MKQHELTVTGFGTSILGVGRPFSRGWNINANTRKEAQRAALANWTNIYRSFNPNCDKARVTIFAEGRRTRCLNVSLRRPGGWG